MVSTRGSRLITRLIFLIFCIFCSSFALSLEQNVTEVYMEQLYIQRKSAVPNYLRLRRELRAKKIVPYIQAGNSSNFIWNKVDVPDLEKSSHAFAGTGLKYKLGSFQFFTEVNFRSYYSPDDRFRQYQQALDGKALMVWGHWWRGDGKKLFAISDIYSETVFTSADENNIIHASFWRTGYRHKLTRSLAIDALVEPFINYDLNDRFYNRKASLKLGFRLFHQVGTLTHSLTTNYVWNAYFKSDDANPYKDKTQGIMALYTFGVRL